MRRSRARRSPVWGALLIPFLCLACDASKPTVETFSRSAKPDVVIKVAASDEAIAAVQRIADAYATRHGVRFEIFQTESANIPELLARGSADMGIVARKMIDEAKARGLNYIPYAYDGIIFIATPKARVRALTSAQLRGILEGRIVNWKEVGGADIPLRLVARPESSSVWRAMTRTLFREKLALAQGRLVLGSSEGVYQAVKTLDDFIACLPMSRTVVETFPAVPLSLDGMAPRLVDVPSARYPFPLEYGVLFPKQSTEAVVAFANYLVSVDGMHAIASLGLVPAAPKLTLEACHCRATEGVFTPTARTALGGQFVLAVVPELGAVEQEMRYAGIARIMAEDLGVGVRLQHMKSYAQMVEEFLDGKIDAGFMGSFVYAELRSKMNVVPLARPESGGTSVYHGVVIVPGRSSINRIADLRGRSVAYVPHTSAGELFVRLLTQRAGGGGKGFFAREVPVPSHAEAVRMVVDGKVEAAAVKDLVLRRLTAEDPSLGKSLRTIETTPSFPENSLIVRGTMSETQRRKLLQLLLSLGGRDAGRAALLAMGADRFIPTAHEDYANVFSLSREAGYRFTSR